MTAPSDYARSLGDAVLRFSAREHRAFLRAVRGATTDRAARGAYADYLEEHEQADPKTLETLRHHPGPVWVLHDGRKTTAGPALTMDDVRRLTAEGPARRWFEPDTMRFFGTRLGRNPTVYNGPGGAWFVTSDYTGFAHDARGHSIHHFDHETKDHHTVGRVGEHDYREAHRHARRFSTYGSKPEAWRAMHEYDPEDLAIPYAYWLRGQGLIDDESFRHLNNSRRQAIDITHHPDGRVEVRPRGDV